MAALQLLIICDELHQFSCEFCRSLYDNLAFESYLEDQNFMCMDLVVYCYVPTGRARITWNQTILSDFHHP
jgi:hypothetical protein